MTKRRLPEDLVPFLALNMPSGEWTPDRIVRLKIALLKASSFCLDPLKGVAAGIDWQPRLDQADADPTLYPKLVSDVLHWIFETTAEHRAEPLAAILDKAQQAEIADFRDDLQRIMEANWFPADGVRAAQQLLSALTPQTKAAEARAYVAVTGRQQDVQNRNRKLTKKADEIGQYATIVAMDVLAAAGFNKRQKRPDGLSRATAAEFLAGIARQHWRKELTPDVIKTWYSKRSRERLARRD